jgi:2-methylisocitrate lyase-like PEP mutase family enzyme
MNAPYGNQLRKELLRPSIIPFIGVYDTFSASIAGRYFKALFLSGFGFAASFYGLPDIGFIAWSDMVAFVQRVRTILPEHHLLVDIDDGYCDSEVACHVVSLLEAIGASGVVLEDQQRPRKCGHFDGKHLLEPEVYVDKLKRVLATRRHLYVVARTDASDPQDIGRRVEAYAEAGPDAILVDGLRDIESIPEIKSRVKKSLAFNQMAGGKSPPCGLRKLEELGVSLVIYSTPCLFAAQQGIEEAMQSLQNCDGELQRGPGLQESTFILQQNLSRRGSPDLALWDSMKSHP